MRRSRTIGVAGGGLGLLGCVEPAHVPKFPIDANEETRRVLYEEYKVTANIGIFSATWKRRDGEYPWDALKQVARQYPESFDVYDRANTRGFVLGLIGGAGGALVGTTLGYNLAAPKDKRFDSTTQVALYSVGGGLIVVSIIAALAWHNPAEDFADVYNRALRHELGIPDPDPRGPTAALWLPHSLGREGYGWSF